MAAFQQLLERVAAFSFECHAGFLFAAQRFKTPKLPLSQPAKEDNASYNRGLDIQMLDLQGVGLNEILRKAAGRVDMNIENQAEVARVTFSAEIPLES